MNPSQRPDALPGVAISSTRRRVALVAGCLAAAVLAQGLASVFPSTIVDPDTAFLLRGMALVKALLVAAAVGAVGWRFGWPTTTRAAWTYGLGVAAMVAATVLIAHLACIVVAAVAFHAGALAVMVVAWRDDGLLREATARPGRSRRASRRSHPARPPSTSSGIASHAA